MFLFFRAVNPEKWSLIGQKLYFIFVEKSEKTMEAEESTSKKFNSMMSMWYGVIIGALQGYLIVQNVWKFVRYAELPWPYLKTPTVELNVYIGMTGKGKNCDCFWRNRLCGKIVQKRLFMF